MTGKRGSANVHCTHVLPRTFEWTHGDIFVLFRASVGLVIRKNGETIRVLNMDTTANMELLYHALHALFDGPSVRSGFGMGKFALVPVNLPFFLKRIRENPKMPYPELFPESTYEYKIVVFGRGDNDLFGRHADFLRSYDNTVPEDLASEDAHNEACSATSENADENDNQDDDEGKSEHDDEDDQAEGVTEANEWSDDSENDEDYNADEDEEDSDDHDIPTSDSGPVSDPDVIPFFLNRGDPQLDVPMRSHLNPVFPILDFALKMQTRMKDEVLLTTLSRDDRAFYIDDLYPSVQHWLEPAEKDDEEPEDLEADMSEAGRPKRKTRQDAKSEKLAKAAPMASVQKRTAKTSPTATSSRAPPASIPPTPTGPRRSQRSGVRARTPEGARKLRSRTVPAASTGSKRTRAQASIADDDQPPKKRARKATTRA